MNQLAAICQSLLNGDVLTIMDGFRRFNCSNIPREISRSIEQKFDVQVSREKKDFKAKFDGKPGYYFRYRLNATDYNIPGIEEMRQYVIDHGGSLISPVKKTKVTDNYERLF
jgi:hypothetical protein